MFVDQVTITVQSGAGGPGRVSFRREKFVPKGGPDGGNGGNGGNVVLRASAQLHTLLDQRYRRNYEAQNGAKGDTSRKSGKWGEHLVVLVPCGTLVKDAQSKEILVDLVEDGQEYIVAKGGKGGRGNAEFATSIKQTPRYAETGKPGEIQELLLELKLLADVGLVGLPNAGKSTLISVLSAARPKIADYPFTTLEPNLGIVSYFEYKSFTLADLPGLIEGAHEGKGLGIKFLKHIERTKVLVILIDCMSDNYEEEYRVLRSELESYSRDLSRKPYIIAMSKMDVADEEVTEKIRVFKKTLETSVLTFSSVSRTGLSELKDSMWEMLQRANDGK